MQTWSYGDPRELPHGADVVGAVGPGRKGDEIRKVDLDGFCVFGVGVGRKLHPVVLSRLGRQEAPRHRVAGEDGGGQAQLGPHVGDRGPLGHRETSQALASVFEDVAHVALRREDLQELEDDVLGRDPGGEFSRQVDPDHLRAGEEERLAGHGERHVEAARADGKHPQRAAGGGVAVGAQKRLCGLPEALQVDLVADAVSGPRKPDAVAARHGLQVAVVVGVLEADLDRVVVDVAHRELGAHAVDPHGLELQVGHGARCVLGERLVDADADFAAGLDAARDEMGLDEFLRDGLSHGPFFPCLKRFCIIAPKGQLCNGEKYCNPALSRSFPKFFLQPCPGGEKKSEAC